MERFVKNFIAMSIVYLAVAAVAGVLMLGYPQLATMRFLHSHLMLLGWVSMMIYGVGYHILPRFAGKLMKSRRMGELHFWTANIGLVGMLLFYTVMQYRASEVYKGLTVAFGIIEVFAIFLFFYNMMVTVFGKEGS